MNEELNLTFCHPIQFLISLEFVLFQFPFSDFRALSWSLLFNVYNSS